MSDRPLEDVAAKLDDISETVDEVKAQAEEGAPVSERKLDEIQSEIARASDAIDDALDPS